jgi:hypothetical protein
MHATELWSTLSPALNHEILEVAYQNEKKLYRHVMDDVGPNLKIRAKMILETPRVARHELFRPFLQLPQFHVVTQNLMILWLATTQVPVMTAFLDSLGIKHDGVGSVDSFPKEMDATKLTKAVEELYGKFPEEKVTAYLSIFDTISGVSWVELPALIRAEKK